MATTTAQSGSTSAADGEEVTVSVVAPAYNEAANVTPLVREIGDAMDGTEWSPYEIVLVDDGSTDATPATLERLASLFPQVRSLQLSRNFGQSHALQAGIDAAVGEYIVTIDADLQNDPADIPMLLRELAASDVECVSGRRADRQDPLTKRVPSRIQTTLAKQTGAAIHDYGCTLKAYDGDALRDITIYGEGHRYIPSELHAAGYRVTEREVNHRPRENGSSHYGTGRLVRGFVDLVWQWFWSRYGTRPMHVFGGLGLLCMFVAAAIGGWTLIDRFVLWNPVGPHLPRLIATVGIGVFGLLLFMFGILAEMLTKLHYENETPYRVRRVFE